MESKKDLFAILGLSSNRIAIILATLSLLLSTLACITPQQNIIVPSPMPQAEIRVGDALNWTVSEIPVPVIEPFFRNLQMVIDSKGRLHLLWDTYGSSGNAFIYHSYFDAGQWTAPIAVAQTLGTSEIKTTPLSMPDGTIHLLWYNTLKLGGPYRLMYTKFDGAAWSQEAQIWQSEKDSNLSGTLFVDSQSMIHAIVNESNGFNRDYYYLTSLPNGWDKSQPMFSQGLDSLTSWTYVPDKDGGVQFYGRDLNNKLIYIYWKDGIVATQRTNTSLRLYSNYFGDSDSNYYIYWTGPAPIPGGTTTGAYYQCINSNLTLWPEQLLSGQVVVATEPKIVHSSSQTIISWLGQDNQMAFLFPKGCSNADLLILHLPESKLQRQASYFALSDSPKKLCFLNRIPGSVEIYCADLP